MPAADAFTVKATRSGTERDVELAAADPVSISGSAVTLTLAEAVAPIDTVTVAYTAPSTDPLRGSDGLKPAVTGFGDTKTVTNDTPADSTVPTVSSAAVNGATLTLTFSEALDKSSVPPPDTFTVSPGGKGTGVAVEGKTVTVTLNGAVRHDHGVQLQVFYVPPTDAGATPLRDLSGNNVGFINPSAIPSLTNNTPPAYSSATVDGATLTVTFNGALDTGSVPAADAFTVTVAGDEVDLADTNPVSVSGSTVTLTLAEAVGGSLLAVTVAYTAPETGPLQDSDNAKLPVTGFGDTKTVTNDTSDSTVPTVSSAAVNGATMTIIFSEPLDEGSVPALTRVQRPRGRRAEETRRHRRRGEHGDADPGRCGGSRRHHGEGVLRQAHGGRRHAAAGPVGQRGGGLRGSAVRGGDQQHPAGVQERIGERGHAEDHLQREPGHELGAGGVGVHRHRRRHGPDAHAGRLQAARQFARGRPGGAHPGPGGGARPADGDGDLRRARDRPPAQGRRQRGTPGLGLFGPDGDQQHG